jgi:phosphoribosylformylglycinamidine cyclo-ligase
MGIGMVLIVSKDTADSILDDNQGSNCVYRIGEVVHGDGVHFI